MARVALERVTKVFGDGTRAVDGLDLDIADGEFMVLVGPSGCGKTTALRMVAGLEEISDGDIRIGGRVVNGLTPKHRDIAMVFQSYALYPHLSVFGNMAFPLRLARVSRREIDRRVTEAAKTLDLVPYLNRKPRALSGGQRQRVAMGRAIVREPAAFLMDEPLSNLDAKLRVQMRADIKKLQSELDATTIYVTHDQVEAMTMGDRVAVMRRGELQQVAPPQDLYDQPVNMFVAGFIGSPAMNMLEARIERREGALVALAGEDAIRLDERHAFLEQWADRQVVLGIRPENLEDGTLAPPGQPRLRATVELREALGSEVLVHFRTSARQAVTDEMRELAEDMGEDRPVGEQAALVGRFSPRTRVAQGDVSEVAADPDALHFFDPQTGLAIR
jgi:multiple sugar transport system ATP-binding protein